MDKDNNRMGMLLRPMLMATTLAAIVWIIWADLALADRSTLRAAGCCEETREKRTKTAPLASIMDKEATENGEMEKVTENEEVKKDFKKEFADLEKEIELIEERVDSFKKRRDDYVNKSKSRIENLKALLKELDEALEVQSRYLVRLSQIKSNKKDEVEVCEKQVIFYEEIGNGSQAENWRERLIKERQTLRNIEDEEKEIIERQNVIKIELRELGDMIQELEETDDSEMLERGIQDAMKIGIEKYKEKYRLMIDETKEYVIPSEETDNLVRYYEERIRYLEDVDEAALDDDLFSEISDAFKRDKGFIYGLIAGYIIPIEFELGKHGLKLTAEIAEEFAEIAEYLNDKVYKDFMVYIDGHADSVMYRGQNTCQSATSNKELSKRRALGVRDYFAEKLGIEKERIFVDWYGNFQKITMPRAGGERENRRVEIRTTTMEKGEYISHRGYFSHRYEFEVDGITFVHKAGVWVDHRCVEAEVEESYTYLSEEYFRMVGDLKINRVLTVVIDETSRSLFTELGNELVVFYNNKCIEVTMCNS
jgi:outer membrane protein OmpA-like peptidoglycan-associated protein